MENPDRAQYQAGISKRVQGNFSNLTSGVLAVVPSRFVLEFDWRSPIG
jgi:hypothetical protein